MAAVTYKGAGKVLATDYHAVKFKGTTKGGKTVTITLPKALNKGNIDWTFADKDDTVAEITFEGVYTNTDAMSTDMSECFTVETDDTMTAGASEIITGAGVFYVDNVAVALSRGGCAFSAGRTYRDINADGDRGSVEGRVVMDESRPTLRVSALTFLVNMTSLYPGLEEV